MRAHLRSLSFRLCFSLRSFDTEELVFAVTLYLRLRVSRLCSSQAAAGIGAISIMKEELSRRTWQITQTVGAQRNVLVPLFTFFVCQMLHLC